MNMKKIFALILAGMMIFSLVACDGEKEENETVTEKSADGGTDAVNVVEEELFSLDCNVGDYIKLGKYEQDNNLDNGKEDIEWIVLDKKDGKALVISKMGIDGHAYHGAYEDITWADSWVREWLNGEFYNDTFSENEKNLITETAVSAQDNDEFETDAGVDTTDKVFLLSVSEVNEYFKTDEERICKATAYADDEGVWASEKTGNTDWWLRTPGKHLRNATNVTSNGSVDKDGEEVRMFCAVRPVMWVNVD